MTTPLDLARPCAHLRQLAGLSLTQAAAATGVTVASVNKPELRERAGNLANLHTLLTRADAYGLALEIRVSRKDEESTVAEK